MFNAITPPNKSTQQGVVILEALIAILIFSFALLGIIGLQAAMIKNTSESKYRAEASQIAQQKIGIMWSHPDPAGIQADITEGVVNISNLLPNGTRTVVANGANQYTVTVTWQEPGDAQQHNFTTLVTIAGGV